MRMRRTAAGGGGGCWALALAVVAGAAGLGGAGEEPVTLNRSADGYRGIWYMNQPSKDEYRYKYSGGLGTYCSSHSPFAVYCPEADATFFCYGGAAEGDNRRLVHMVSSFDHTTGTVPRPTLLLDKKTDDAHDNPVLAVDEKGYVWVFSTSHGRSRPSYVHKSTAPYRVAKFERVAATYERDGRRVPLDNFSYLQVWPRAGAGFAAFLTHYNDPAARTSFFMAGAGGGQFGPWVRLAAVEQGHYQVSGAGRGRVGTAFNHHPAKGGLNARTNLYYLESADGGKTWTAAGGRAVAVPVTDRRTPALVHDYQAEGLLVYLMDVAFDSDDRPVILYLTSRGYEAGPKNGPRTWRTARWTGAEWDVRPVTASDSNYDMGSLYLEADGTWRVIGPTEDGPQAYNPGGEMAMWVSRDRGQSWARAGVLTGGSPYNHTYARRPVNAHEGFYAFWSDGHARRPSECRLYFCDRRGQVYLLPPRMAGEREKPQRVPAGGSVPAAEEAPGRSEKG